MNRSLRFILYHYLVLSWLSKKRARSGSAISVTIPVLGVTVGVFAFTVVLSVMSGFVENIKASILQFEPHFIVTSIKRGEQIQADKNIISNIKKLNPEITKVTAFQAGSTIIQAGNKAIIANLQGIDPNEDEESFAFRNYLSQNTKLSVLNETQPSLQVSNSSLFPTVILGVDLMNQLDLQIGDTVTLVSPIADDGPGGFAPIQIPVVVAGFINSGHFSFDKKIVLTSIKTANLFLQNENTWQGFYLTCKEPMLANILAKNLNKDLKNIYLKAIPWTENNKELLKALTLEHYGMSLVLLMIILVGCFSITISLLLSIRRKSREMAILRSLGLTQKDLSKLFLWQGSIIGITGIIIGLIFAFCVLYLIHNYQIPFITNSYSTKPLPILINYTDIVIVIFGSLILSMLAAVWPAYEIKNLNVIEVLSIRN